MTIRWSQTALDQRTEIHDERAKRNPDAADKEDLAIAATANALDGVATFGLGPYPDTYTAYVNGGAHVLIYRRRGNDVLIETVRHTRTNWKDLHL